MVKNPLIVGFGISLRKVKEQYMRQHRISSIGDAEVLISESANISQPTLRQMQSANNIPSTSTIRLMSKSNIFNFDYSSTLNFVSSMRLIGKKITSVEQFNKQVDELKKKFSDIPGLSECLEKFKIENYELTFNDEIYIKDFLVKNRVPEELLGFLRAQNDESITDASVVTYSEAETKKNAGDTYSESSGLKKAPSHDSVTLEDKVLQPVQAQPQKKIPATFDQSKTHFMESITGMEFVKVDEGMFEMGHEDFELSVPLHWVYLSEFWLGRYPVTIKQFELFLSETGYDHPRAYMNNNKQDTTDPVTQVSWEDAIAYCQWMSKVTSLTVSLPSESQWEYAARGQNSLPYPWGRELPDSEKARFGLNIKTGMPVNSESFSDIQSPFGTVTQLGNVWEWCLDKWNSKSYEKRAQQTLMDPVEQDGEVDRHVVRGAGWQAPKALVHSAYRCRNYVSFRGQATGFRVAIQVSHETPDS